MSATPRREPKTINAILPGLKPGEPGDEVVDGIIVGVVLLTEVVPFCVVELEVILVEVEFEGSVVTVMFPVLFEVVVRTVVVDAMGIVIVWIALVVDSGPNVIVVGEGDCVVAFVVVGVGRVVAFVVVGVGVVVTFVVVGVGVVVTFVVVGVGVVVTFVVVGVGVVVTFVVVGVGVVVTFVVVGIGVVVTFVVERSCRVVCGFPAIGLTVSLEIG